MSLPVNPVPFAPLASRTHPQQRDARACRTSSHICPQRNISSWVTYLNNNFPLSECGAVACVSSGGHCLLRGLHYKRTGRERRYD
ncbi:hypothetical protein EVAR_76008_1 [Eumeta japonica]|uniref:Uncharacterized protein n=1 Tax=Eumeta variegata TaxID=151549 RepID=A0A4C1UBI8_EUMVA|nr:hypothetical protein EVAR_76008_1 [Eumeta japonica]